MNQKMIVAIAVGLMATGVLGAFILSRPGIAFRNVQPLRVTGYAELPVKSDVGIMSATVTVTGPTTKYAYEEAGKQLDTIETFLKDQDPESYQIKETPSNISEVLKLGPDGKRTNQIDYYVVRRTLRIESSNVDMMESLSRRIYDQNAHDMRVNVSGPRYLITDLGETKLKLVKAATRNAMERAGMIARNAKAGLGKLVAARQGVIQITQPNSTDTSDWGTYDTSTIDKVAKITVKLELAIQ